MSGNEVRGRRPHLRLVARQYGGDAERRTPASTFISSELFNTAAGGGNPA